MRSALSASRLGTIDAIRGFAAVNMIAYHLLYDLLCVYSLSPGFVEHPAAIVWARCIGFTFIILSGASINFSRHGYRRGGIVLLGSLSVTLLTLIFIPSEVIWFGVLHFLGCAILITSALRRASGRLNPAAGAAISLLLFALLYGLPFGYIGFFGIRLATLPGALYGSAYLAFLGLPSPSFHSGDYYPLLPWIFLYFFGYYLWRVIAAKGWDRKFKRRIPALDFIGRHCLVIYLLHQPLIFGVCYLVFGHF